jgi:hypothetical protein
MTNGEFSITFPAGHFDREFELPYKGYVRGVQVESADGRSWRLYFTDLSRLQQDLGDAKAQGLCYFAEVGTVVLSEVTTANIRCAINALWQGGFFNHPAAPIESA